MPELSEYHPNDPKNPDRAKFLSRRRNSQFSRSDDPYHDLRGSIPQDVRHNQQSSYSQQFTRQYLTRPRNPPAASSSYVHQRRSSPEGFYSQSKDYNSTVPQEHYSSEYTRPLSSSQRVGSHNESSSRKSTRYHPAAPQEHHTSRRPLRNYTHYTKESESSRDWLDDTENGRTHPLKGTNSGGSKLVKKSALDYIEPVISGDPKQKLEWINPEELDDSQLVEFFAIVHFGDHVRERRFDTCEKNDRMKEAFDGIVMKEEESGLMILERLKEMVASKHGRKFGIRIQLNPEAKAVKRILKDCSIDREQCCSLGVLAAYRYIGNYIGYSKTNSRKADHDEADYEEVDHETSGYKANHETSDHKANHGKASRDKKYFNDPNYWEKNKEIFRLVQFGRNYKEEGVYDARLWDQRILQKLPILQPEHNPHSVVRELLFGADVPGQDVGREEYDFKANCTTNFLDYLRSEGWYRG